MQPVPSQIGTDIEEGHPVIDQSKKHRTVLGLIVSQVERHDRRDAHIARITFNLNPVLPRGEDCPAVCDRDRRDRGRVEKIGVRRKTGVLGLHPGKIIHLGQFPAFVCVTYFVQ